MMTSSNEEIEFINEEIVKEIFKEIANAKVKKDFNWQELKAIFNYKLKTIPCDLVKCDSRGIIKKCITKLDHLTETPFTIQRICELMLMLDMFQNNNENDSQATIQYKSFEKFLAAVYKCLNVTGKCDDISLSTVTNIMDTS